MLMCFVLLSFRISFTNFSSFIPPFLPFLLPALSTLLICSSRRLLNFLFIVLIIIKRPSQQNFVLSSFNWFELLPVSSCPLLPSLRVTFSCVVVVSNFLIFGSILHNLFKLEKCIPQSGVLFCITVTFLLSVTATTALQLRYFDPSILEIYFRISSVLCSILSPIRLFTEQDEPEFHESECGRFNWDNIWMKAARCHWWNIASWLVCSDNTWHKS